MAKKIHVNPYTNVPNTCGAQIRCRFKDTHPDIPHFDTMEEAQAYADAQNEAQYGATATLSKSAPAPAEATYERIDPETSQNVLKERLKQSYPDDRMLNYVFDRLENDTSEWKDTEREDLEALHDIHDLALNPTRKNLDAAHERYENMHKVDAIATRRMKHDEIMNRRDHNMKFLAQHILDTEEAKQYRGIENPPPRERNDRVFGLDDARRDAVQHLNMLGHDFTGEYWLSENVTEHIDNNLDRIAAGEQYNPRQLSNMEARNYATEEHKLMAMVSNPDLPGYDHTFYMQTVFPDNELREAFEKHNVHDVSVSFVENGREDGLAYTVIQPDGAMRTFQVYEHRNTDSIVIAGTTNWEHGTIPRSSDSKDAIFAEFAPEDTRQVADALSFYAKSAQQGELSDDKTLEETAERRDWMAILSDDMPEFKEWAEQQGYGMNTTREEKQFGIKSRLPKIPDIEDED